MAGPGFDPDQYLSQKASGFDPDSYLSEKSRPGSDDGIIGTAAKAVDSVTGAPTRAAIYEAENAPWGQKLAQAWQAGKSQFANMTDQAPSGADIAAKAGLSTKAGGKAYAGKGARFETTPSDADMAGVGIDLAANPLNFAGPAVRLAGKVVGPIAEGGANLLRDFAENKAVNATGATGKQASTFAPEAGRELLDRGIVRFGDSQAKISKRAAAAVEQANQQIDQSLTKLQAKGVTVNANDIYNTVQDTINEMRADPSKADIANNLESELHNIIKSADATGTTRIPIQDAENIKRGYGRKAGNWADPEKSIAGKEMYQTFRGAVEDAAHAADPETAQLFQEGKKAYGLLTPMQEAAERRSLTTGQHQAGGMLDLVAAGAGESAGGPIMAIAAPIARRIIGPRIGSSLAVAADQGANILGSAPQIANVAGHAAPISASVSPIATAGQNLITNVPAAADQDGPKTGPSKWANDGFQKLKSHGTDEEKALLDKYKGAMLVDPKAKNLLISASSFSPGSKPLNDIMKHLKNRFDEGGK